jgi:hypothetical protein
LTQREFSEAAALATPVADCVPDCVPYSLPVPSHLITSKFDADAEVVESLDETKGAYGVVNDDGEFD